MKCPCGSEKNYSECCHPLHNEDSKPESAEALMRSRYSAFVLKLYPYLRATIDPQKRNAFDFQIQEKWAQTAHFSKLEVLSSSEERNKGLVEFKAYYETDGRHYIHHELSQFRKQAGIWYFRDGKTLSPPET